ncbi:SH3 domain-containing protein [Streptomyces gilvosporeus]|uniref:SH3 domain-containing protein n=1 Tax=Streptomyces gilvosporeus TaxID=553510 RepID=UPI001F220831|nr:SH3 domain-containing protein [Streptomyces gilvosporeus]
MSTSDILAVRGRQLAAGAGALTAALALGATLLAASPAQAATPPGPPQGEPYGVITASGGLNLRQDPSTDAMIQGHFRHQARVGLKCKVRGQSIGGNSIWYLIRDREDTWVSAKHVNNSGNVKFCKDVGRNRVPAESTPRMPKSSKLPKSPKSPQSPKSPKSSKSTKHAMG